MYHVVGSGLVDLRAAGTTALGTAVVFQNRIAAERLVRGEVRGVIDAAVTVSEDGFGTPQSFSAEVDCLVVDGNTAWIGGTVRQSTSALVSVGERYLVLVRDRGGSTADIMHAAFAEHLGNATCEDKPTGLRESAIVLGDYQVAPGRVPEQATLGSIRVVVSTAGPAPDPDGYEFGVGPLRHPIAVSATLPLEGLFPSGQHSVRLEGLARNCTVFGDNPTLVTVRAGETVAASFSVDCTVPAADVRVLVQTTGDDIDDNGYVLRVGAQGLIGRAPANGSVIIPRVPVGSHGINIDDIAPNCSVGPSGTPIVSVLSADEVVDVSIAFRCLAFGRVNVRTVTTGSDIDATGYTIASTGLVAATPVLEVAANAEVAGVRIAPGPQVVWLRGLAGNCVPRDAIVRQLDVPSGVSVDVTFGVDCSMPTRLAFALVDASGNADIYTVWSVGSGTTRLTDHAATDADPAWSPRGSRIAFTSNRDGEFGVYVMDENGSDVRRLTPLGSRSYRPAWSPDGERIAFVSERDGNAELYVMNADGTNQTRLTHHAALDTDPDWSPDGSRIAFMSDRDGNAEIYTLALASSRPERVTDNHLWDGQPAWSPDGGRIAFTRERCTGGWGGECARTVLVADATGANPVEIAGGEDPAWSPDGSRIAVTTFFCTYTDFYTEECLFTGLGIASPLKIPGYAGRADIWEMTLTHGRHRQPTWRP